MENNNLELKMLALKEGFRNQVAKLTDEYEDRIADLRVELTNVSQQYNELQQQVAAKDARIAELEAPLVQEEAPADSSDDSN
jgi:uncharacterized protein involved in exopolysaccharide biosynthesis